MEERVAAPHPDSWRELYQHALVELDATRLAILIHKTRLAIYEEMRRLAVEDNDGRGELLNAMSALDVLQRECDHSQIKHKSRRAAE